MGAATVGGGGCNRMWWRLQPYVMGRTGWDGAAHQNASRRLWLCFVWLCTLYGYTSYGYTSYGYTSYGYTH